MKKYSDDEIRSMKKVTCKIAGDYLGVSPMFISIGMRQDIENFDSMKQDLITLLKEKNK